MTSQPRPADDRVIPAALAGAEIADTAADELT